MLGVWRYANVLLGVLRRLACDNVKLANLPLVSILVELPSGRRGLNSKCPRPLGAPGTKKEEEEIDAVYCNNEIMSLKDYNCVLNVCQHIESCT
jgi:hypothetical protein